MPWKILWGELFISKPNSLFMPQADHSKTIHLQKFIPNVNVIRKSVFNRAHITRSLVTTNSRSVKKRVSDATFHRVKRERTQLTCRNLVRCPVQAVLRRFVLQRFSCCCIVCWMPIKNAHNRFNDWFYLLRPELKNKLWHRNPLPNRTNICALAHGEVGKCLVYSETVHMGTRRSFR